METKELPTFTTASPEWQAWADQFLDNTPERLQPPELHTQLLLLTVAEMLAAGGVNDLAEKLGAETLEGNILSHRLVRLDGGLDATMPSGFVLAALMADTPGEAVMWAIAVVRLYQRTGKPGTLASIMEHYGRKGLPTKARLNAVWDAQKIGGANMLDRMVLSPEGEAELERRMTQAKAEVQAESTAE